MSRPGFFFLVCPDSRLIKDKIEDLLAAYWQNETYERAVFWGDEEIPPAYWEAISSATLFGEKKAVILRRAEKLKDAFWVNLSTHLKGFNPGSWPFFCLEGEWEKGKPKGLHKKLIESKYFAVAGKKGWVWESSGLKREGLAVYLKKWAEERKIAFPANVLSSFSAVLPLDASALKSELDKLELYLGERRKIEPGDLQIVSSETDIDIFEFISGLQKGGTTAVWKKMLANHLSRADDSLVFPLLVNMVREAKILWRINSGEADKIKLPPFILNKKRELAARLGQEKVARIVDIALETEMGIKSGGRTVEQALEMLVVEMSRAFSTELPSKR